VTAINMIAIVASRLIPVSSSPLRDHPACCHAESLAKTRLGQQARHRGPRRPRVPSL